MASDGDRVAVAEQTEPTEPVESPLPTQARVNEELLQHLFRGRVEGFKATGAAGQAALKSALLINGGAAVALLAYLGSVDAPPGFIPYAMLVYVAGVLTAAVASGCVWVSRRHDDDQINLSLQAVVNFAFKKPQPEGAEDQQNTSGRRAYKWSLAAAVLVFISCFAFALGSAIAFRHFAVDGIVVIWLPFPLF